jgi:electron transport complex protein RnfC
MLFRRYGTFSGGIDLPQEHLGSRSGRIEQLAAVPTLRVPLALTDAPAKVLVAPGQRVEAGQRLASSADRTVSYSPVSGRALVLTTTMAGRRDGFVEVPAVEIEPDADAALDADAPAEADFDWRPLGGATLREHLAAGGLTTFRSNPESLEAWVDRARAVKPNWLMLNVAPTQPYLWADHRLLVEFGGEVIRGLAILGRCIGAGELILAVDQRRTGDYECTVEPSRKLRVSRVAVYHKYPIGADHILVKVLTRREVPVGGSTLDVGAAVIDAATCLAAWRWVAARRPPVGRVVTIEGENSVRRGNFWLPFGTPCGPVTGTDKPPLVHGGPMTGRLCPPQAVVTPATNAVLALKLEAPAPPAQCIRCGWCTDHCPARLNVAALNEAYEMSDLAAARRLGVQASVECGICTYVCPARLPLADRVAQLKRLIKVQDAREREGQS